MQCYTMYKLKPNGQDLPSEGLTWILKGKEPIWLTVSVLREYGIRANGITNIKCSIISEHHL